MDCEKCFAGLEVRSGVACREMWKKSPVAAERIPHKRTVNAVGAVLIFRYKAHFHSVAWDTSRLSFLLNLSEAAFFLSSTLMLLLRQFRISFKAAINHLYSVGMTGISSVF